MNLLITGGCGFIGSELVRTLARDPRVNQLVNLDVLTYAGSEESVESSKSCKTYRFIYGDIRDLGLVASVVREFGITHVVHLAAESHVDRSLAIPAPFITTNVVGTFNLIEACRDYWGESSFGNRFLHVSTDEVFGDLAGRCACKLFNEESPYQPSSPYSASKAGSDHLVASYARSFRFPCVITNCSNNYGPWQFPEKLIPIAICGCMERSPIPIHGAGDAVRDWIHVSDHVSALTAILFSEDPLPRYTIGARCELANRHVVSKVCDLFDEMNGTKDSKSLMVRVPDRPGQDLRYGVDNFTLRHNLNWSPRITIDFGLKKTIQWYQEHRDWVKNMSGRI